MVIHEVKDGLIILERLPKYWYIYTSGGGGGSIGLSALPDD
jgi:hypothetical protein